MVSWHTTYLREILAHCVFVPILNRINICVEKGRNFEVFLLIQSPNSSPAISLSICPVTFK